MHKIVVLSVFLSIGLMVQAQEFVSVKGLVYHDLNSNGKREKSEPGIAGVAVSNGSDVVLTDASGAYQLQIQATDGQLFVIKPSAYNYPVNKNNLPQFFYLHKPNGAPKMKFETLHETGPLPESVDFGLLTGCDSEVFSVIVASDPQAYTEEQVSFYETDIVNELKTI